MPQTPKANKIPTGWDTGEVGHNGLVGRYPKNKNNNSFDAAMAIMPEIRNKRSVWTVNTFGFSEAHFATFPPDLIKPCILAGSRTGDVVLDPFIGSGTTAFVSKELGRKCIGVELNEKYIPMIKKRTAQEVLPL